MSTLQSSHCKTRCMLLDICIADLEEKERKTNAKVTKQGPCLGVDNVLVADVDISRQDLAQHNDLLLAAAGHAVHEAVQQLDGGLEVKLLAVL